MFNRPWAKALLVISTAVGLFSAPAFSQEGEEEVGRDLYPKTVGLVKAQNMAIKELEALYLQEKANEGQTATLINYGPQDPLTLAEQLVLEDYTASNIVDNARIVVAGVCKIPPQAGIFWRGTGTGWYGISSVGQTFEIQTPTSVSSKIEVAQRPYFMRGQLVKINTRSARSITKYSQAPGEGEHLILPGAQLKVVGISNTTIHIRENESLGIDAQDMKVRIVELKELDASKEANSCSAD